MSMKRDERKEALTESIAGFCRDLAQKVEKGDPSVLKRMLDVYAGAARRWSHNNLVTIITQKPAIVRPVTISEARALGHFPAKGSKAAFIFVPVIGGETPQVSMSDRVKALMEQYKTWAERNHLNPKDTSSALRFVEGHDQLRHLTAATRQNTAAKIVGALTEAERAARDRGKLLFFKVVPCVYDLGVDTEGPDISESTVEDGAQVQELYDGMKEYAASKGWSVEGFKLSLGALGSASPGKIEVGQWLDIASQVKILAHEIAHQQLHIIPGVTGPDSVRDITRNLAELQAEAVAYAVCRHFGVQPTFSGEYIREFGGTTKEIMANLAVICKASRKIIEGVGEYLNKEQQQAPTVDADDEVETRYYLGDGDDKTPYDDYVPLLAAIAQHPAPLDELKIDLYVAGIGGSFYLDRSVSAADFISQLFSEFVERAAEAQVEGVAFNDKGSFGIAQCMDDVPEYLRDTAVQIGEAKSISM